VEEAQRGVAGASAFPRGSGCGWLQWALAPISTQALLWRFQPRHWEQNTCPDLVPRTLPAPDTLTPENSSAEAAAAFVFHRASALVPPQPLGKQVTVQLEGCLEDGTVFDDFPEGSEFVFTTDEGGEGGVGAEGSAIACPLHGGSGSGWVHFKPGWWPGGREKEKLGHAAWLPPRLAAVQGAGAHGLELRPPLQRARLGGRQHKPPFPCVRLRP